ncbi:MAG: lipopolysaccharide transport periplasmic protein LptA [Thermodesulfobacteriota bacterium]|nr:lipopolysaccharide transport periplasmic protein LptA [Thermodesulfobacteriota bacterium]
MRTLFLTIIIFFITTLAIAADPEMHHDANQPVKITSQQLEADDNAGNFVFTGDVQAQQGDVFIYAQKMTVTYVRVVNPQDNTGEKRQIDQVVAEDDVRIVQLNRVATGQRAVFYHREGRIVLTGDPRVAQGDNAVEGERIIVYFNDSRSIVEGSDNRRVKAVFIPGEQQ